MLAMPPRQSIRSTRALPVEMEKPLAAASSRAVRPMGWLTRANTALAATVSPSPSTAGRRQRDTSSTSTAGKSSRGDRLKWASSTAQIVWAWPVSSSPPLQPKPARVKRTRDSAAAGREV